MLQTKEGIIQWRKPHKGGDLDLQFRPRVGDYTSNLVESPPISPLCPHEGRWGKTLIGALHIVQSISKTSIQSQITTVKKANGWYKRHHEHK